MRFGFVAVVLACFAGCAPARAVDQRDSGLRDELKLPPPTAVLSRGPSFQSGDQLSEVLYRKWEVRVELWDFRGSGDVDGTRAWRARPEARVLIVSGARDGDAGIAECHPATLQSLSITWKVDPAASPSGSVRWVQGCFALEADAEEGDGEATPPCECASNWSPVLYSEEDAGAGDGGLSMTFPDELEDGTLPVTPGERTGLCNVRVNLSRPPPDGAHVCLAEAGTHEIALACAPATEPTTWVQVDSVADVPAGHEQALVAVVVVGGIKVEAIPAVATRLVTLPAAGGSMSAVRQAVASLVNRTPMDRPWLRAVAPALLHVDEGETRQLRELYAARAEAGALSPLDDRTLALLPGTPELEVPCRRVLETLKELSASGDTAASRSATELLRLNPVLQIATVTAARPASKRSLVIGMHADDSFYSDGWNAWQPHRHAPLGRCFTAVVLLTRRSGAGQLQFYVPKEKSRHALAAVPPVGVASPSKSVPFPAENLWQDPLAEGDALIFSAGLENYHRVVTPDSTAAEDEEVRLALVLFFAPDIWGDAAREAHTRVAAAYHGGDEESFAAAVTEARTFAAQHMRSHGLPTATPT